MNGKSEHSPKPTDAFLALLRVKLKQYLGIAAGLEAVTASFEKTAQLLKVVNFPVENQSDRPVLRDHRLGRRIGKIDYFEPAVNESNVPADICPPTVRTALSYVISQSVKALWLNLPLCQID